MKIQNSGNSCINKTFRWCSFSFERIFTFCLWGSIIFQEHHAEMPHISMVTTNHIQGYLENNHSSMIVYV